MTRSLLSVLVLAACTYAQPADVEPPADVMPFANARLVITSGSAQSGAVGTALPEPLVVTAIDESGNPISDLTIQLSMTGGGSLLESVVRTDVQGRAFGQLTLGTTPGQNTVEFRVDGLALEHATFSALALTGAVSRLTVVSGDGQSATVGLQVSPLVVRVSDKFDNPVTNTAVDFVVTTGNGMLVDTVTITDSEGRAHTGFTLGTLAGANKVEVHSGDLTPVVFGATGQAGVVAQLVKPASTSGDNQVGQVATLLGSPFVIAAQDEFGNGVAGVQISFVVTAGGGTLQSTTVATDASGEASSRLTLGSSAGANRIEARHGALLASFVATGTTAAPNRIQFLSAQTSPVPVNTTLTDPFVVRVTDSSNNPISGFTVTFVAVSGNGAATPTTAVTDPLGRAQTTIRVGTRSGPNQFEARGTSVTPTGFGINGVPGPVATVAIVSGANQRGTAGVPLAAPFVVRVTDAFGNATVGQSVGFVVTAGTGTMTSASTSVGPDALAQSILIPQQLDDVTVEARVNGVKALFVTAVGFRTPFVVPNVPMTAHTIRTPDLNSDGKPDLVIAHANGIQVRINTTIQGSISPTFGNAIEIASSQVTDVAAGDVNGDGKVDLAFSSQLSSRLLLNATPPGSPIPVLNLQTPDLSLATGVVLADLDSDGRSEVILRGNSGLRIFSAPSFDVPIIESPTGYFGPGLHLGDFDIDGRVDVLVSGQILLNRATSTFAFSWVSAGSNVVAVIDVDGDHRDDVAESGNSAPSTRFLLNASTTPGVVAFTGVTVPRTAGLFGDVDGDTKPDLLFGEPGKLSVTRNQSVPGTVILTQKLSANVGIALDPRCVVDLNGDGRLDVVALVALSSSSSGVAILLAD